MKPRSVQQVHSTWHFSRCISGVVFFLEESGGDGQGHGSPFENLLLFKEGFPVCCRQDKEGYGERREDVSM